MNSYLINNTVCKIPKKDTPIYKDECVYCFDSTDSEHGLFICMKTFIGVCKKHLDLFYRKSKNQLFLNIRIEKRIKISIEDEVNKCTEYTKMLKKVYSNNNVDSIEISSLLFMPLYEEIKLPCELPVHVNLSVQKILTSDSVAKAFERALKSDNWDGNYLIESKHAWTLQQLDNGVKVAPNGWKCCYCEMTTNLWMNLTDGTILCGRKFYDGSGGNNHAMDYFQQTKYPLAVKLGTITPAGADVFSYDEDDMVLDPLLGQHLEHFGIDIMKMEKTDKTTEELEMDNLKYNNEKIAITELGTNQELLSGPGLCGIVNIGNSCYLNSVLQVLLSMPVFQNLYTDRYLDIIEQKSVVDDVIDFRLQLAKLGHFLRSGDYSQQMPQIPNCNNDVIKSPQKISPHLLRSIIGKGHPDFSTNQQQDTLEYLMHVLNFVKIDVQKNALSGVKNPLESVAFKIEDRIFCQNNGTVKYQERDEFVLSLSIALDEAINRAQVESVQSNGWEQDSSHDAVRPIVNLQSCLDLFMREEDIQDYVIKGCRTTASKSSKIKTFPEYLWIQMRRFTVGSDWTPKKLDVEIEVPDEIDLSNMMAKGLQPGETGMQEGSTDVKIEVNQFLVSELLAMGFPDNACKKAVYLTGNASLEEAANWLMMHCGDDDFDVLPAILYGGAVPEKMTTMMRPVLAETDIDMMTYMGFSRRQGIRALEETGGNLERAADWALSHPVEMAAEENEDVCMDRDDGTVDSVHSIADQWSSSTKYSLCAMISHMGNNAHVGHYVCHIRQQTDDTKAWIMFNDDMVQACVGPPKKFAYLYLFKRHP